MQSIVRICLALAASGLVGAPSVAQHGAGEDGQWRYWGGDPGGTGYSALDQIHAGNVHELEIAWTWRSDNFGGLSFQNQNTPIMVDGVLYFAAGDRRSIVAVDAGTGETLWMWRIDEGARYLESPRRNPGRGVAYWSDGDDARIFTVTPGFQLAALDARTGVPVADFGEGGIIDLYDHLNLDFDGSLVGAISNTSPPVVAHDVVVVGPALRLGTLVDRENLKGDVLAFDARSGDLAWIFHTIPREGEPGRETWGEVEVEDPLTGETGLVSSAEFTGNAGVWAPMSVDEERGIVYLPVEAPTNDFYGGHRPGDNLYSGSLVALDIRSGERLWHYQIIRHDIWDADLPSQPILVDLTVEGEPIPAVVQLTKQNLAFVFNRETGEPVWPIEEYAAPASDVPGEQAATHQPVPTRPAPYDVLELTEDELIDFTPELRAEALQIAGMFRPGRLYSPPSRVDADDGTLGTLMNPGFTGGANWEGGVADPETGFVYVASKHDPSVYAVRPAPDFSSDFVYAGARAPRVQGLPLNRPPYGRITAYDMNEGEIVWQIANGVTPPDIADHPALQGLDIPRTGSPTRSGMMVTASLLFAGEGWGGQPWFRAIDKQSGEILWEAELPGMQAGRPMTYLHEGRQYIVVSVGSAVDRIPARFVAFALPE